MSAIFDRGGQWDEVNEIGTVCFNGCTPIPPSGIEITVSEGWNDATPLRRVLLTCHGGSAATEYHLDFDKAEALGHLLLSTAKGMRDMAEALDREAASESNAKL